MGKKGEERHGFKRDLLNKGTHTKQDSAQWETHAPKKSYTDWGKASRVITIFNCTLGLNLKKTSPNGCQRKKGVYGSSYFKTLNPGGNSGNPRY